MNYLRSDEIEAAATFAYMAHTGQSDKAGRPFIGHPVRVAAYVAQRGRLDLVPAAYLHDVVEDTGWSLQHLIEGPGHFSKLTVSAVEAMTRRSDEPYADYILRIADAGFADLKLADLRDNMDPHRVKAMQRKTGESALTSMDRAERYASAVAVLKHSIQRSKLKGVAQ